MVTVTVIKDDDHKRILRCSEGNRIWYLLWITQLDMNNIERYFDNLGEVKRWWIRDLQIWYVFSMRRRVIRLEEFLGRIGLRIY